MPKISAQRWFEGSVDEAVANHLTSQIKNLTAENLSDTLDLFLRAFDAGFSEPLIATVPKFIIKMGTLLTPANGQVIQAPLRNLTRRMATLLIEREAFVKALPNT